MNYCGIDFGTSNSSVSVIDNDHPTLIALGDDGVSAPSAIFYCFETDQTYFGKQAVAQYSEGVEGRLLRSLKSVLGSSLIDEMTAIKYRRVAFRDIIRDYLMHLNQSLNTHNGGEPTESVVLGRPVRFVDDNDERDAMAENELYSIAAELGFKHIEFQFEPIAAALNYESTVSKEELALVVDIGGGTADFSVIRVSDKRHAMPDRSADILSATGVHVGGTDLDRCLSLQEVMPFLGYGGYFKQSGLTIPKSYYFDLATWHKITLLYTNVVRSTVKQWVPQAVDKEAIQRLQQVINEQQGHRLAGLVEEAKIALSSADVAELSLSMLDDPASVNVKREGFEQAIDSSVKKLKLCINQCLQSAAIDSDAISTVFYTGGTSAIPSLRSQIQQMFPSAKEVQGDVFGSVAKGLAIDAKLKFG